MLAEERRRQYLLLMGRYSEELEAAKEMYQRQKDNPPLPRGTPPG
jgi:hypothetical protein